MDYRRYSFSWKEWVFCILGYAFLDGVISFLFFDSWIAFLIFLPGIFYFAKLMRAERKKKRLRNLSGQFLSGMQAVSNALSAGYSIENAFGEALEEMEKVYGTGEMIVQEFSMIVTQLSLNRTVESLLDQLALRSGQEDIQSFAEVFKVAKRSGGDLIAIIRNTVKIMQQKEETRQEIQVCIASKKLEQNLMSVIPLFILIYVGITSPGFLDGMYHNLMGIVIMGSCLGVYLFAWILGRKMVEIEV